MTTSTTFTKRTNSPFRADFVGSFLRPAELANARNLHRKGIIVVGNVFFLHSDSINFPLFL